MRGENEAIRRDSSATLLSTVLDHAVICFRVVKVWELVRVARPAPFADKNGWQIVLVWGHRVNMTRVRKTVLEAIRVDRPEYPIACVLSQSGDGLGKIPLSLQFKTHRTVLANVSNLNGIWRFRAQYDKHQQCGGKNKNNNLSAFHDALSGLTNNGQSIRHIEVRH
jgi:hypothetical protein